MFFALFVFAKFTTLGDTSRWMSGTIKLPEITSILTSSSNMLDFLGGISSSLLGTIFGNLPFMILAFYGIYYSVSRLKLNNKQLVLVLFLLSFPSFGVWSSIAGKEAMSVFFMGIILGYIIDLINKDRYKLKMIELFAIYLMFIFKPQYSLAIFSIIIYVVTSNKLNLKSFGKSILLSIHITLGLVGFWIFKDVINELSFMLPKHFSLDAGSTRDNTIWIENYDIFFNAHYGMFIGFFGPTYDEVLSKPIQGIFFIESLVIISLFVYVLSRGVIYATKTNKINIYIIALIFMSVFWLLFVHYPFGALNPGSAIRYRENFYGFLVVFIFFMYLKVNAESIIRKGAKY